MIPTFVSPYEGCKWFKWTYGEISEDELSKRSKYDVEMGSCKSVHALAFGDVETGYGNFPRWDCVNGWTHR